MKVQVIVKTSSKAAAATAEQLEVTVTPGNTVSDVQERVASLTKTSAFPGEMLFNGKTLIGNQPLSTLNIAEGDTLEFLIRPSDATFVKQLSALIGKNTVALEELGLLYIHRHGSSIDQVMNALGHNNEKFLPYLESQKCFSLDGGLVKLAQSSDQTSDTCSTQDTEHGLIEVRASVKFYVGRFLVVSNFDDETEEDPISLERSDTVSDAKKILASAHLVPFPDLELTLEGSKLEDHLSLTDAGVKCGASLVLVVHASEAALASQLEDLVRECTALSPNDLGLRYCQRFGTPLCQALRTLGFRGNINRFIESHSRFSLTGGCVTLTDAPLSPTYTTFSTGGWGIDLVIDALIETAFLNVDFIRKEEKSVDGAACATVFVKGLPPSGNGPMLASLQKAIAAGLKPIAERDPRIEDVSFESDLVRVQVEGEAVCLRLMAAPLCFQ